MRINIDRTNWSVEFFEFDSKNFFHRVRRRLALFATSLRFYVARESYIDCDIDRPLRSVPQCFELTFASSKIRNWAYDSNAYATMTFTEDCDIEPEKIHPNLTRTVEPFEAHKTAWSDNGMTSIDVKLEIPAGALVYQIAGSGIFKASRVKVLSMKEKRTGLDVATAYSSWSPTFEYALGKEAFPARGKASESFPLAPKLEIPYLGHGIYFHTNAPARSRP